MRPAKMERRGGRKRKYSDETVYWLGKLVESGWSIKDAAARLGLPYSTAIGLRRYRILGKKRPMAQFKSFRLQQKHKEEAPEIDMRSPICKRIQLCSHSRCYLHVDCPAYEAWQAKYQRRRA